MSKGLAILILATVIVIAGWVLFGLMFDPYFLNN